MRNRTQEPGKQAASAMRHRHPTIPTNPETRHVPPMPDYRRNDVPGGTYFFTANLLDRRSTLLVTEITTPRAAVRDALARAPFHIDAWVVLSDHMHCIWTLPPGDDDHAGRSRALKKQFTKSMPSTEPRSPPAHAAPNAASGNVVSGSTRSATTATRAQGGR